MATNTSNQYKQAYNKIVQAVKVLYSQKKLSRRMQKDWKYVTTLTDPLKQYQEAIQFFNQNWNAKDLDAIIKSGEKPAPPEPVKTPGSGEMNSERLEKALAYYNKAISYLKQEQAIPLGDYRNYLDITRQAENALERYNRIREWYVEVGLPDIKKTYAAYQRALQTKLAKVGNGPSKTDVTPETGIDLAQYPAATQNLLKTYIKSLTKLTGKQIKFV